LWHIFCTSFWALELPSLDWNQLFNLTESQPSSKQLVLQGRALVKDILQPLSHQYTFVVPGQLRILQAYSKHCKQYILKAQKLKICDIRSIYNDHLSPSGSSYIWKIWYLSPLIKIRYAMVRFHLVNWYVDCRLIVGGSECPVEIRNQKYTGSEPTAARLLHIAPVNRRETRPNCLIAFHSAKLLIKS